MQYGWLVGVELGGGYGTMDRSIYSNRCCAVMLYVAMYSENDIDSGSGGFVFA